MENKILPLCLKKTLSAPGIAIPLRCGGLIIFQLKGAFDEGAVAEELMGGKTTVARRFQAMKAVGWFAEAKP